MKLSDALEYAINSGLYRIRNPFFKQGNDPKPGGEFMCLVLEYDMKQPKLAEKVQAKVHTLSWHSSLASALQSVGEHPTGCLWEYRFNRCLRFYKLWIIELRKEGL